MAKGGATKKLQDTLAALDQGQLKKALYLTEADEKISRQHQFVEEAARTCLANKGDKEACSMAIKEAKGKIQDTITLPIDDTSLEGLEEYLPLKPPEGVQGIKEPEGEKSPDEMTDEELYESCEPCHIAVAASQFANICAEKLEGNGKSCELISQKLEDETTEPVDWIKAMVLTAENTEGKAKQDMVEVITDLTDYLQRRDSDILKELDKEEE